ncbi:MAG: general secretion pathway protein GspD [Methylophaga sp.]|nr:MAG: general secretion pathway protein GspD [Methylophaga sp.]
MTKLLHIPYFLVLLLVSFNVIADTKIKELEFADTQLIDVIRTLSELSNSNIIATPAVTKNRVTIHLKNVTVLDAIKSISRISDLWYRYDEDTNTYRIMTREEYGRDLIVRESENIEVFKLLNANVQIIAQAIQDLYGNRVILSLGVEPGQSGMNQASSGNANRGGGGVRNSRATGRSNRANRANRGNVGTNMATSGTELFSGDLTADQLAQISASLNGQIVDTETLQQVSINAQPIYITVNNEHSMILVRTDDRNVIAAIGDLIKKLDIAIPQVMLEMQILNIILGEDFNSIFNFELQPSGGNQSQLPIEIGNNALLNSGSLIYEFLNSRLRANIEFLEQNKRVRVLSNPMVLASNHREAELFIGEESLLTRGFTFNPAVIDNGIVISPSYIETQTELEEIGITLRITPRINADDTVTLEIEQENSTINPGGATLPISDGAGNVLNLPVDTVNTARLTGTVVARNNLTVAIGGLIRTSKTNTEKKVPILSEIPVLGRIFRTTIESEEDTEMVLLITPRILSKPQDSQKLRQADNPFYQSLNDGFPDLAPFPNKFIDKEPVSPSEQLRNDRQNVYLEMSQYAADTIRIAEIERTLDQQYLPAKIQRQAVTGLFDNKAIKAMPLASWNRGGLHVTAVELVNKSNSALAVDYQQVNGKWLASSVESSSLARRGQANDATYLYLISALPFNETMAEMK